MTRAQLEHIIRAAGAIAGDDDMLVVGSQSLLGQFPEAPEEFLISLEADVVPLEHPERSDLIDAALGDGSWFERTYGYFAHGVGLETSILPAGRRSRLIPVFSENTSGVRWWCLEVHDPALAKLAAGRPQDLDFVGALVSRKMAKPGLLRSRADGMASSEGAQGLLLARLKQWLGLPSCAIIPPTQLARPHGGSS